MTQVSSPSCFHCGLPVPDGTNITIRFQNIDQPVCCHGCEAVANAIIDSGMDDFYRFRTANPEKPETIVPEFLQQLKAYDNPQIQRHFVAGQSTQHNASENRRTTDNADIREVSLILEGIVCAACVWLNENHLLSLSGVTSVNINYSNHRARICWDNNQIQLSDILEAITRIGYIAHPYDAENLQKLIERERKQSLKRLGIAGTLGMQIMILAVAMYSGSWWGMDPGIHRVFRWISLGLTIPVLLFAADVFFKAAWRDLRNLRTGMDVPVSLGISIAFIASCYHTIIGTGEVYFDSVAMFTFFLLSARHFELNARKHSNEVTEGLLNQRPAIATRIEHNGAGKETHSVIAVTELQPGDRVLVRPGEVIPADGIIDSGTAGINESLLTGESLPVIRTPGDPVMGGSINTESPIIVRIEKTNEQSVLASIQHLLEQAQSNKPHIAKLADRLASWFVGIILLLATLVAVFWYQHNPDLWVAITVATLVVTCPCALSLATPAAITAASGQLALIGLLPKTGHALETLATITDFVFDKTGTLTTGKLTLVETQVFSQAAAEHLLQIAATLEKGSEHPIAHCLLQASQTINTNPPNAESAENNSPHTNSLATNQIAPYPVDAVKNTPGAGVEACIKDEIWFIGKLDFIQNNMDATAFTNWQAKHPAQTTQHFSSHIYLATTHTLHARFVLQDTLREESTLLIKALQRLGKQVHLMSGDGEAATQHVAKQLGIVHYHANLRPQDKLEKIQALQSSAKRVAMTGDGINDAPVLAGADLSIAMGSGAQLAVATADMVLLNSHILNIAKGYQIADKCLHIIRQNLFWALTYNLIAVPAAALGYVAPWMAALGMSASSLLVVLNALRLKVSMQTNLNRG